MIFTDIVTNRSSAPAELRALGLPASWAKYAGDYYWDTRSVRFSPLYNRYEGELTDGNIAHYLLTHPGTAVRVGQQSAEFAQQFRITTLGDYPVSAGHPKGAYEARVTVFTWLARQLSPGLGLWLYLPLWIIMAALAALGLTAGRPRPWHRDGAALVLCMTGCALVAFVPPAYFAGISTTRHMVGMNLSTMLALIVSVPLAISLLQQAGLAAGGCWRRPRQPRQPSSRSAPARRADTRLPDAHNPACRTPTTPPAGRPQPRLPDAHNPACRRRPRGSCAWLVHSCSSV